MWYAMFSYNLEYAEHSHYISGATHVYRDVLYFIFYFFCLSFPLLVCALSLIKRKRRFVNIFWHRRLYRLMCGYLIAMHSITMLSRIYL